MSDTRVHCNFCHRRSIGVDKLYQVLVPHTVRSGRKGRQCPGVGKPPSARPERSAA